MRIYDNFYDYPNWVKTQDTLSNADRQAIREAAERFPVLPLFSIVLLPTPDGALASPSHATVISVLNQIYHHWELWLPRGASSVSDARVRTFPDRGAPPVDSARLFNAALAVAEGEFMLPLSPDVMLAEHALYELAAAIGEPKPDLLYTDEDRLNSAGERCMPWFKTAWDPDLALGRNAVGSLVAYRKALMQRIGGMRPGCRSLDLALYELSLRVGFAVSPVRIRHVPAVLCHRRSDSETSLGSNPEGAREIVRRHLAETGVSARVVAAPLAPGWNRVIRDVPEPAPLVSIIVPTRDRADLLVRCVEGLLNRTDYPAIEVLILDNDSKEPGTTELLDHLSQDPRVWVLPCPGPFNYSKLNNLAVQEARGEILVLLNNDTDVIGANWLRELVSHAVRPDVGAVGAKLLYPDGRVQHGGMVLGPGVWPQHQLRFADRLEQGPGGELALTRAVSAVTGACLALRRSVFFEVGGLNENLRVSFSDVDLCLRIGDHGYRVIWTPFAELSHVECASRGYDRESADRVALAQQEARYFGRFWRSLMQTDPFHNPNIIYKAAGSSALAAPPRRRRPWAVRSPGTSPIEAISVWPSAQSREPLLHATAAAFSPGMQKAMVEADPARREAKASASTWEAQIRESEWARERIAAQMAAARRDVYQANLQAEHSETRAERANAMAREAEDRARQAEARAREAEFKAAQAERQRDALLQSTAWRMTWPLRAVAHRFPPSLRRVLRRGARLARWCLNSRARPASG
jgi:O-antigen biosynthesis protein